jgi:hypothetical protein
MDNASAQCDDQVTYTAGTQTLGFTQVAVSSYGTVDVNSQYCTETFPYFIGYTYSDNTSGTGSYSFQFDPPIDSARFNVSGISLDAANEEEIWLFVNGAHYAIPEPGSPQVCDPMAILTPEGNIEGCQNCSVSGWGGTVIPGPITTLTIMDSVILGQPAGSIFSLFICAQHGTGMVDAFGALRTSPYPNPATEAVFIDLPDARSANVSLFDGGGRQLAVNITIVGHTVRLNTAGLPKGLYGIRVQRGEHVAMHRVAVE